jgi:hypothetical protein
VLLPSVLHVPTPTWVLRLLRLLLLHHHLVVLLLLLLLLLLLELLLRLLRAKLPGMLPGMLWRTCRPPVPTLLHRHRPSLAPRRRR